MSDPNFQYFAYLFLLAVGVVVVVLREFSKIKRGE